MASSAPRIDTDARSRHNSLPSNSVPFPTTPVEEPPSTNHNHHHIPESQTGQGQSSETTAHNVQYRMNDYPATYPFTSPRHSSHSNPNRISFSSSSPGASPSKRPLSVPGPRPSHSMTRAYSASSMRHRPIDQQLSPVAEEYDHPLHGWQARLLVPPAPRRSRTSLNPYPYSDPYHNRQSVHGQGGAPFTSGGTPLSSNGHIPTSVDSSAHFHTNYAYDSHNHNHANPSPLPVDDLTAAMMLMMPSPTADRKRMAEKNRRAARTKKKRASRIGAGSGVKRVASAAGRAVMALRRALGARMRQR
ncbi:uncharacterized protein STEHIDRAFT_172944 [Stereum hirsutum FP-91666 SS1]|uniref:Uncharacterized protein n=1 Tax=Stereum hirsutum (strain FP-91666) TaxID=721885 RepID=R7RX52_STEHR|nr:uncharacterized protein STEHIDRAFT_172944 [Stereum hirsutum FP-91666 SS1]EIM79966.1 hypothetical protein STEHIDRAFT_172944 [Stereum hirsutum FP-91666 SS1]